MPEWISDPTSVTLIVLLAAGSTGVEVMRRQPRWAVAATAAGSTLAYSALRWAVEIGPPTLIMLTMGAVGMYLWTLVERPPARWRKAAEEPQVT